MAKDPSELLFKASEHLDNGKHAKARTACEQAIAIEATPEAYALLAQIADAAGDAEGAIAALEKVTQLAPERPEPWSRLATMYMTASRWDKTKEAAARAIAIRPFDTTARSTVAIAAIELGELDEAWAQWAVIELAGDSTIADGLGVSIEAADFDQDIDAAKDKARAAANAQYPRERDNRALLVSVLIADLASLRAALAAGADPNARDEEQLSALHHAAYDGQLEMVRALLDAGADPNVFRIEVMFVAVLDTPLERARHAKHRAIVKLLKERGAKEAKDLPDPNALAAKGITRSEHR